MPFSTICPRQCREIRERRHRCFPREMDLGDIQRVVRDYAEAAYRAKEGGRNQLCV